jgi:hypothetical protein
MARRMSLGHCCGETPVVRVVTGPPGHSGHGWSAEVRCRKRCGAEVAGRGPGHTETLWNKERKK